MYLCYFLRENLNLLFFFHIIKHIRTSGVLVLELSQLLHYMCVCVCVYVMYMYSHSRYMNNSGSIHNTPIHAFYTLHTCKTSLTSSLNGSNFILYLIQQMCPVEHTRYSTKYAVVIIYVQLIQRCILYFSVVKHTYTY